MKRYVFLISLCVSVFATAQDADSLRLSEVRVTAHRKGNSINRLSLQQTEDISRAGLVKMACCNVAESFQNSASVTVGYADAVSGARQIRLLGLTGNYTQLLDESRPLARGVGSPFMLNQIPGSWLNGISVSKGVTSVAQGHEAISGQINMDFRKPSDAERLFVNMYIDSDLRGELNLSSALKVNRSGRLQVVNMLHASTDTRITDHDMNHDHFRDTPLMRQLSIASRWNYLAANGVQIRWGLRATTEGRTGGMNDYRPTSAERTRMQRGDTAYYGSNLRNQNISLYAKVGIPVGRMLDDPDSILDPHQSSIAVVADYDRFAHESYFGRNDYDVSEHTVSMSALLNYYFTYRSSLNVGLQSYLRYSDEQLQNRPGHTTATSWLASWHAAHPQGQLVDLSRDEAEVGAFAEYNYSQSDKLTLVAGVRGDYNSYTRTFYGTPRMHVKWNPTGRIALRASAGLGYRLIRPVSDNIGILATGALIDIPSPGSGFDPMEQALNLGLSYTHTIPMGRLGAATLSLEYFRTQFFNTVIVDQEQQAERIVMYSSGRKSFTNNWQADFSWTPVERLEVLLAFRFSDSRYTIDRQDGSHVLVERPLVSRMKGLLNVQYATRFRRWVFDLTAHLNGRSRVPTTTGLLSDDHLSPVYPMFYAQVTHRIKMCELYLGCENIAGYMQSDPVISADDPMSASFNSMNVWGPLMGRKFYFGLRWSLY